MGIKTISDILSHMDEKTEVYKTDHEYYNKRKRRGIYSRNDGIFDFLFLVKNWEEIVGKMLSENTIPLRIKNNNLIIMTKHSIFSQELSLISPLIIQKIEENFPIFEGKIKNIKFSNGKYSADDFNTKKEKIKKTPHKRLHRFDPNLQSKKLKAKEIFKDIDDEEMQEILERLFILKD